MLRLVALFVLSLSPRLATAGCVVPNIEAAAQKISGKDWLPALETQLLRAPPSDSVQWARATWEGPVSGVVIAFSCAGEFLAGLQIGATESWRLVRLSSHSNSALWAEYIAGTGTSGYLYKKVGLFALVNGKVVELWGHDAFARGFEICGKTNEERSFRAILSPSGTSISVTGTKTLTTSKERGKECTTETSKQEKLPTETYCWNGTNGYESCATP